MLLGHGAAAQGGGHSPELPELREHPWDSVTRGLTLGAAVRSQELGWVIPVGPCKLDSLSSASSSVSCATKQ